MCSGATANKRPSSGSTAQQMKFLYNDDDSSSSNSSSSSSGSIGKYSSSRSIGDGSSGENGTTTTHRIVVLLLLVIIAQSSLVLHGFYANGGAVSIKTTFLSNMTSGSSSTSMLRSGATSSGQQRVPSMSTVGLCAIVKDVSRYVDEWTDYNLLALEFTEMFLYDNNENFVLGPWAEKRRAAGQKVTATHVPGQQGVQNDIYNKCMQEHGHKVDYMAFFDDDEYLVLYKHDRIADLLDEYLVPGSSLSINWRLFGSANKTDYAPLPITYRYQYREAETDLRVKCMVRPKDWVRMASAHSVVLKKGDDRADDVVEEVGWRDTSKQIRQMPERGLENHAKPHDVAVLHHYKYKSKEEWDFKSCVRKDVPRPHNPGGTKNCGIDVPPGDVKDTTAWDFLKRKVPKYAMFEQFEDYA